MNVICGIYKFENKLNNKVYIGKSTNIYVRYKVHLKNVANGKTTRFYSALRKYGIDNFNFEIIEECPKKRLNERERYYISIYNSNDPSYGYNMTVGGDGGKTCEVPWNKGIPLAEYMSPEQLKKMGDKISKANKGRKLTNEHREKISKNHAHYWKDKVSPWKDKHPTEETKKKQSDSHKGQRKGMHWYVNNETNKRVWYS